MHHQRGGRMTDHPDRHKILARVITDILVKRRTDGEGAGVSDQKGVAVRLGLGRRLGADGAAGTAAIVDDDALSEQLAHLVGDDARDDGGAASRRKRNDEGDGAVRPGLRLCMMDAADKAKHKSENAKRSAQAAHPTTSTTPLSLFVTASSSKARRSARRLLREARKAFYQERLFQLGHAGRRDSQERPATKAGRALLTC